MDLRLPVVALSALLLCGCEIYAVPSPITCPGTLKGTFDFVADQVVLPTDCFFAQPEGPAYQVQSSFAFSGTISFAPDGSSDAALCKGVPHAAPNLGTHAGDTLDVASVFSISVNGCTCPSPEAATASRCGCPADSPSSNCSCPVLHEQRIQGALRPVPGGYSGFDGTLVNTVQPAPGLDPTQICDCQRACTYSYELAATTVGSR